MLLLAYVPDCCLLVICWCFAICFCLEAFGFGLVFTILFLFYCLIGVSGFAMVCACLLGVWVVAVCLVGCVLLLVVSVCCGDDCCILRLVVLVVIVA